MAKTKIQWCDYTFNPWRGCAKVSAGCDNCYAALPAKRNPKVFGTWGPRGVRVLASDAYWKQLLTWNRQARQAGARPRIFVGSMCDVFEQGKRLRQQRARLYHYVLDCDCLDFMLLTKRIGDAKRLWGDARLDACGNPASHDPWPANVWLGTTIENAAVAADRLRHLLRVPASRRFLSLEPLLGPINLVDAIQRTMDKLDWSGTRAQSVPEPRDFIHEVIIGGESGPHARPCRLEWIRDLLAQADAMGIPAFVKQIGSNPYLDDTQVGQAISIRGGKSDGGIKHPKGGDPAEWPADLRGRAYPAKESRD